MRHSTFERYEITPLAVENAPAATLIAIFFVYVMHVAILYLALRRR